MRKSRGLSGLGGASGQPRPPPLFLWAEVALPSSTCPHLLALASSKAVCSPLRAVYLHRCNTTTQLPREETVTYSGPWVPGSSTSTWHMENALSK